MQWGVCCKASQPGFMGTSSDPPSEIHWAHRLWDYGDQTKAKSLAIKAKCKGLEVIIFSCKKKTVLKLLLCHL